MKIRSEKLFRFLLESGVLDGSEQEIALAKQKYRRMYKRKHAQNRRKQAKEIRFYLTNRQMANVRDFCKENGIKPTGLSKDLLLCHVQGTSPAPQKETLLPAYRNIGLAINRLMKSDTESEVLQSLLEVEEIIKQQLV